MTKATLLLYLLYSNLPTTHVLQLGYSMYLIQANNDEWPLRFCGSSERDWCSLDMLFKYIAVE